MKFWQDGFSDPGEDKVTSSQESLIVSILSAGTFFGALLAAPVADFMGRRLGLMFSTGFVFNLGVILQTAATHQPLFVAGRFFAGLGVGLVSAISELDIAVGAVQSGLIKYTKSPCTSPKHLRNGLEEPS